MLAKSLSSLAHAVAAGFALGAWVPVIPASRVDVLLTRVASCAFAVMVAAARRQSASASIP
jgi:phosphate acetyltransferase